MDNCKFPGISQFNSTKSDYGISMDQKSCWEATEDHFMCLDKFNDVYDNHQKCKSTYEVWSRFCPNNMRKNQMIRRSQARDDLLLYKDQAFVDAYNKEKNERRPYADTRENGLFTNPAPGLKSN